MKSCLYFGEVSHHRKSPKRHDLRYKLFMPHLFLDELDQVFQGRFFWSLNRKNLSSFQRSDYHKPEINSLENAVRATMSEQLETPVKGPISVLTHLRTFGHCFNPVTFYYAWNESQDHPQRCWQKSPTPPGMNATPKHSAGRKRTTNPNTNSSKSFMFHLSSI